MAAPAGSGQCCCSRATPLSSSGERGEDSGQTAAAAIRPYGAAVGDSSPALPSSAPLPRLSTAAGHRAEPPPRPVPASEASPPDAVSALTDSLTPHPPARGRASLSSALPQPATPLTTAQCSAVPTTNTERPHTASTRLLPTSPSFIVSPCSRQLLSCRAIACTTPIPSMPACTHPELLRSSSLTLFASAQPTFHFDDGDALDDHTPWLSPHSSTPSPPTIEPLFSSLTLQPDGALPPPPPLPSPFFLHRLHLLVLLLFRLLLSPPPTFQAPPRPPPPPPPSSPPPSPSPLSPSPPPKRSHREIDAERRHKEAAAVRRLEGLTELVTEAKTKRGKERKSKAGPEAGRAAGQRGQDRAAAGAAGRGGEGVPRQQRPAAHHHTPPTADARGAR